MPEGPEVETVRRTLRPLLVGRTLGKTQVSSKALRTRVTARAFAIVEGRRVVDVDRHGKALFIGVDGGAGLQVRLGMTGRVLVVDAAAKREPHTHVRIVLGAHDAVDTGLDGDADADGAPQVEHARLELRYVDARRFGEVVPYADAAARAVLVEGMGPDALALDAAARDVVRASLAKTDRVLKDVLLDQSIVAGVGNIYAAEALFEARLSPFRPSRSLRDAEAERLIDAVVATLAAAVERRGTSFSDYVDANGEAGENSAHLAVFQREGEPCPACGRKIRRAVQGQRSTFFCAACQPRTPRRGLR